MAIVFISKNGKTVKFVFQQLSLASWLCSLPLRGYPPPPTLHPYKSACGVDKKQSKMAGKSASCGLCSG